MFDLEKEFNNLVLIKSDSTLLTKEDSINKKLKLIKDMYNLLNDDLKLSFINILRNNTITNIVKEKLSEEELNLLNRENIVLKYDFICLTIILNCLLNFNLEKLVE